MKLYVHVAEARGLMPRDPNGFSDPFVRLSLGNSKARTAVVYKNLNPVWHEDFFFNVADLDAELKISVWDEDRFTDDFLGQAKVPVGSVLNSEKQSLMNTWIPLDKRSSKSKFKVSGEILVDVSLFGRTYSSLTASPQDVKAHGCNVTAMNGCSTGSTVGRASYSADSESSSDVCSDLNAVASMIAATPGSTVLNPQATLVKEFTEVEKKKSIHFGSRLSSVFNKKGRSRSRGLSPTSSSPSSELSVFAGTPEGSESGEDDDEIVPASFFQDDDKSVVSSEENMPRPLSGGVVLDQDYAVSMKALNALLFKPGSAFVRDLGQVQKTTELVEEPWKKSGGDLVKRALSYRKAPTKLVKAVVASEEQVYQRADDKGFVVFSTVSTPDVPYGKNFVVEFQFAITPIPNSPTGEKASHLTISWRLNFLQNTMMRTMIVNGATSGIKESYDGFAEVLAKYAKPLGVTDGHIAALGDDERPKSDWELVVQYFGNLTVLLAAVSVFIVVFHIMLVKTNYINGLEIWYLDFPDSFVELITAAIVVHQVERVGKMIHKFTLARLKAGDHGVKALGDGWLLTVALLSAENLMAADPETSCDAYVVFTCNGKIRTSSVTLGSQSPQWKEVYEFDATEDPPSTLDIEIFNYDGPFQDAESLGHAEINFLKSKPEDLADIWIPLLGKASQKFGPKLHLRVFLSNTKEGGIPEYIEKVEKEVGTKIVKKSGQKNSQFQKLFSLPPEEFLINDFACAVKRKIPIQGRLFLSPRMLGFYSNLFGHKTKFSFLWDEVAEIKENLVSPGSLFNPSITITMREGRGLDARQGAKGVDTKGRFKFQFLSFVRSGPAFRTIIALWKNRTLTAEQQLEIIASVEAGDVKYAVSGKQDEAGNFLGVEEANMSEIFSMDVPVTVDTMVSIYTNTNADRRIMENLGVYNYKTTVWEIVAHNVERRQVSYTLSRQQCHFGSNVSSIQQKTVSGDKKVLVLDEIYTLHDVPFGDFFQVQVRKEGDTTSVSPPNSRCKFYVGVAWQKSTPAQKKTTKNVYRYMHQFCKERFELGVKEILGAQESSKGSSRISS